MCLYWMFLKLSLPRQNFMLAMCILINTVLSSNLSGLNVLKAYFKIADILKIKAAVFSQLSHHTITLV